MEDECIIAGIKFFDIHTIPDGSGYYYVSIKPTTPEMEKAFSLISGKDCKSDISIKMISDAEECGLIYNYAILQMDGFKHTLDSYQESILRELLKTIFPGSDESYVLPDISTTHASLRLFVKFW